MLTFRRTNLALLFLLLLLAGWDAYRTVPWWAYALVLLAYSLVVFYGVYFIQSGFFMKTLYRGDGTLRAIALSFDDGPSATHTPRVLDILNELGVPATFFCIGKNIAGNEALVQRIAREGHLLGNHSFTHSVWFDLFPAGKIAAELQQTDRALESLLGRRPAYFRPPFGVINPLVRDAVQQTGHRVVGWNIRSYDTVIGDNQTLMRRLMRRLRPGAIVLLHDHGKKTVEVLPDFIRAVRAQGYAIVPLDQLIHTQPYV